MVPLYLKYMGAEAYGLVGFFGMIQVWFGLLDMGLTLTLARETARLRGNAVDVLTYRNLMRALELIFLGVGVVGSTLLFFYSASIASTWLNVQLMDIATVIVSLQLMAVAIALRWMSGLYRGVISGAEDFVWLSVFNSFIATWRFIGVLPFLIWIDGAPIIFFGYQCGVGLVELIGVFAKARRLMPALPNNAPVEWSLKLMISSVRHSFVFSIGISFAALVWVTMTQVDKLLLSALLPLADYGVFTLSVLAASGVNMIVGPLSSALLPRLARLHAQGDDSALILLYKKMTRVVVVIVVPTSFLLALFSEKILFAWTGNQLIAQQGEAVLSLYAIGNCIMAVSAFPYYLQYANGKLRLHLIGSGLFLAAFIPTLLFLTQTYGAIGAGYAWLAANIAYFVLWTPVAHDRFAKGHHVQWLIHDVVAPGCSSVFLLLVFAWLMSTTNAWPSDRLPLIALLVAIVFFAVVIAMLGQSIFRNIFKNWTALIFSILARSAK